MTTKKKQRPYSTKYQADPETAKRYLLSGIPPGLWRKFQARCKREHVAMRQVILDAVAAWTARPRPGAAPAVIVTPATRSQVLPGQLPLFEDAPTRGAPARRTSAAARTPGRARRRRGSPS